jgi:hypothetical protein
MSKCKFLIFVSLVLAALAWGIDQSWAQQAPKKNVPAPQTQAQPANLAQAEEEAAAVRAEQGLHRSVTNAQRKAAAARNASRSAAAAAPAAEGGTK